MKTVESALHKIQVVDVTKRFDADALGLPPVLDRITLDPETVAETLGALLKYQDDVGAITPEVAARLVREAQAATS